jgi:hypothetical protein
MKSSLKEHLQPQQAPNALYGIVLTRVAVARRKAARVRSCMFAALALVSGLALLPAVSYASYELYASGFSDYLSLLTSDQGVVQHSWQQFAYVLLESLPSLAIFTVLVCAGVCLWALSRMPRTVRVAFSTVIA